MTANIMDLPLREIIANCGAKEFFHDGNLDGDRAVCWARLSNDGASYIIAASNGFDIWRVSFEKYDLVTQYESSEVDNLEKFLDVIKYAFESSTLSLVKVGNKVILHCPGEKNSLNFDLYEAKINDKKSELHYIMFNLTDKVKELRKTLTEANEALEMGREKERNSSDNQEFGYEPARKSRQGMNLRRKPQGSSLVNPSSKKAKRAKGISFE
ncbi:uncharacterized protein LOC114518200 [Dendronephthya gigantea]|uniref:uncharacterized protein LOC114518200 n=1 Tax=Dendronephthya gigantea TaxID=151771 RepID=UPI00106CB6A6|nr:uncharacterized protein LOC114518200 [Dendronephthya gigantea]